MQRRPGLGDPAYGQPDAGAPARRQAPAQHDGAVPGVVPGEAGGRVDAGVRRRRAVLRHGARRVARGSVLPAGEVTRAVQGVPRRTAATGVVRVMELSLRARCRLFHHLCAYSVASLVPRLATQSDSSPSVIRFFFLIMKGVKIVLSDVEML